MEEGAGATATTTTTGDTIPDLKDIEMKIGRKTPEGLLRCLREEASALRGDVKQSTAAAGAPEPGTKEPGRKSLDEKIRKLKMEMAHLRSVDVKILHQLLAVHEGIESVKWLLEERSTLTSRCSSLTSSQYSLGEGPDTSWRGSWSSLQDPNDKLDNISVGSYLDTLADDMDEYCPSSSESVICTTTPLVSEATAGSRTGAGAGVRSVTGGANGIRANENGVGAGNVMEVKGGQGPGVVNGKPVNSAQVKPEGPKQDVWTRAAETGRGSVVLKDSIQAQSIKVNGIRAKSLTRNGSPTRTNLGTNQSPKLKPYTNGKIELDTCKMNGKMHLEYDAHWRWVQSQEDVTFL